MLKLKMMPAMMLPLVVVGCTSAVCQSAREAITASGVDKCSLPRLADTAERGLFHPRERLITMQKTTGRNPEVY